MKRLIAVLTLVFGTVHLSNAQGTVVEDGFGFGGGFESGEGYTLALGNAGYAAAGIVNIGLSGGRMWFDDADVSMNIIGPSVTFYPIRQTPDIPVSIGIGGNYSYGTVVSDLLADGESITQNTFGVNGSLFHELEVSDQFRVIPEIGGYFSRTTQEVSGPGGSLENSENITGISGRLGLVFMTSETTYFALTPALGVSEGSVMGGASLMLIFPTN